MKNLALKAIAVFMVFFIGMYCLMVVDSICLETTRYGGNLLFNVENLSLFN